MQIKKDNVLSFKANHWLNGKYVTKMSGAQTGTATVENTVTKFSEATMTQRFHSEVVP